MQNNAVKAVLVCVIALLGWLTFQNYEQYEQLVDYGWSEKAKRNPYLAMHQYLEGRVTNMQSVTRFGKDILKQDFTTLLIPDANYIRLPSQQREVLAWIQAGGHLIVGIGDSTEPAMLSDLGFSRSEPWDNEDDALDEQEDSDSGGNNNTSKNEKEKHNDKDKSLADEFREQNEKILKAREKEGQKNEDSNAPVCKSPTQKCNVYIEPEAEDTFIVELNFEGIEDSLHINFPWQSYIEHEAFFTDPDNEGVLPNPQHIEPFYWQGDDNGIHFVQTNYGEGMISILSDFDIWQSARIGHFDHAYLLSVLVDRDEKVLLLYGKYMPSLDVLIYRHFFEALISFIVLLILCLIYFSRRFGPIYSLTKTTRRSRGEQFTALSQFRWQHQDNANLLQHIRSDIVRLATRHWHNFADLAPAQQYRQLASMCDLPITTIEKIMHGELRCNENEFTHTIRALQILRNSL